MYTMSGEKDLQISLNNFNKCKRIYTIFGTCYPDDRFY